MQNSLGAVLRRAREAKGPMWTLDFVARQIGRPGTWLSNLETGKTKGLPEPTELRSLADILGLTMVELMQAAGFLAPSDLEQERANPFDSDDPRYQLTEGLRRFDPTDEYESFALFSLAQLMRGLLDADRTKILPDVRNSWLANQNH